MKIRNKLKVIALLPAAFATVIFAVILYSNRGLRRSIVNHEIASDIVHAVNVRAAMRDEYLLSPGQNSMEQWLRKNEEVTKLIRSASGVFTNGKEKSIFDEIEERNEYIYHYIPRFVADHERTGKFDEAVIKQLRKNVAAIVSSASQLERISFEDMFARSQAANMLNAGFIAVVTLFISILAYRISNSITVPLNKLHNAADTLAQGNLDHEIVPVTDDEFGQVSKSFNEMADRLKEYRNSMEELVKKRTAELNLRAEELEAVNKELESFSYSVSHDLRAPLRSISGFCELLSERAQGSLDEKSMHYLEVIASSSRQMGVLIDDLLSFSRMGRSEMMKTRVNMEHLVKSALNDLAHESAGRNISWEIKSLPDVPGDPSMLRLVFTNLLSNSVKYTRTQPEARIEIGTVPGNSGETVYYVRDNGVGFDMKYESKLFGLFQRLHPQEEFDGTGVGLANVRRIVQRHGGRTWAEGKVGEGAVFYFSLPEGTEHLFNREVWNG